MKSMTQRVSQVEIEYIAEVMESLQTSHSLYVLRVPHYRDIPGMFTQDDAEQEQIMRMLGFMDGKEIYTIAHSPMTGLGEYDSDIFVCCGASSPFTSFASMHYYDVDLYNASQFNDKYVSVKFLVVDVIAKRYRIFTIEDLEDRWIDLGYKSVPKSLAECTHRPATIRMYGRE